MTTFLLAVTALSVTVLLPFIWWLRRSREQAPDRDEARMVVLRDRRAELDAELADGRLDHEAHAQACRELEDLALSELEGGGVGSASRWPRQTTIGIVIAVPLVAASLYLAVGGHDAFERNEAPAGPQDLVALVDELATRMQATPDDLQGWMLLGRSSVILGQYPRAVAAWREASRLAPDDPTVLANFAEAMVLADGASLAGEAGIMLEQALRADPTNPKALWYGGLAADQRGEFELAQARLTALLAQDPPQPFRQLIESRLGLGFALEVVVDGLDAASGFLFVTLHDADGSGPPLAATRVAWPADSVRIGSTDVMQPGTRLEDYQRFRVLVRWSADGDAARNAGDRWAETSWSRGDEELLQVTLDHEVD